MIETIEQLSAWLDQPVYGAGVLLYERFVLAGSSGSGFVLGMLKTGEDDYNRQTLVDALTRHRDALTAAQQALVASYPDGLTNALAVAKGLMDERTVLKERMRMQYNGGVMESDQIKTWAYRVLTIRDELRAIYDRKHFFDRHGYLPDSGPVDDQPESTPMTANQILQRMLNLRTYVTRTKKQLQAVPVDSGRFTELHHRLKGFTTELHTVEAELKQFLTVDHAPVHD